MSASAVSPPSSLTVLDNTDYQLFRATYGRGSGDPLYNPCADFDASGAVGLLDYQQWRFCYRAATAPRPAVSAARVPTSEHMAPSAAVQPAPHAPTRLKP